MKTKNYFQTALLLLMLSLILPAALMAQTDDASAPAPQARVYSQEELDRFLAPIALYPDALLSQILMASTYPLEVVEADRWLQRNQELTPDALDEALRDKSWDISVKSLCRYPKVLATMSDNLQLTNDLGNAFLGQPDQVMDTIQRLRAKAQTQGNLSSTDRERVTTDNGSIIIEPVRPDVVYVPAYDPCWVYGPWWYPACAPLWFWYPNIVVGAGFFFGPPIFIGPFGPWSGFHWHRREIFVDYHRTLRFHRPPITRMHGGSESWRHNPVHRRGIEYRSPEIGRRFGQMPRAGVEARRSFRGFDPEGKRPGIGTAPQGRPERGRPPTAQPRTGSPGTRTFEQPSGPRMERREMRPRSSAPSFSPSPSAPARRNNAFEGFGSSGREVTQQRDRGFNSMRGNSGGGRGFQGGGAPRGGAPRGGGQRR